MYSWPDLLAEGLPHSDIHGSKPARGSPWLFAACHVLHRLLMPRHPPNALIVRLIRNSLQLSAFSCQNDPTADRLELTAHHHAQKQTIHRPIGGRGSLLKLTILILSFYSTPLNAQRRGLGAARIPRTDIRSDLADRGTPRDAPEPDSQYKRTQHPKPARINAEPKAPKGNSEPPPRIGERYTAPMANFSVVTVKPDQSGMPEHRPKPTQVLLPTAN